MVFRLAGCSIVIVALCLIGACSYQTQSIMDASEVENVTVKGPSQFRSEWLDSNSERVVESAVNLIKQRHPSVAVDFPNIEIVSVDLGELEGVSPENRKKFETDTAQLLETIRHRIVVGNTEGETWQLEVKARSFRGSDTPLTYVVVAGLPTLVVCFKSIFMVCPGPLGTGGVLLEAIVKPVAGKQVQLAGAGYSLNIASTVMLGDSMDPESSGEGPRARNALVASIVSLADALVRQYEEQAIADKVPDE